MLYILSVPCKHQLINLSNIIKQIKLFIFSEINCHAEFKKLPGISAIDECRRNGTAALHTYIWKSYFSLQCYTNISSFFFFFFSEVLLFSTGVSTWRAGVPIPVIAPSAIFFRFHMHTKDLNNAHKSILMLKLGSAAFLFAPQPLCLS